MALFAIPDERQIFSSLTQQKCIYFSLRVHYGSSFPWAIFFLPGELRTQDPLFVAIPSIRALKSLTFIWQMGRELVMEEHLIFKIPAWKRNTPFP